MGYKLTKEKLDEVLAKLGCKIFAPKCYQAGGRFSDTNLIRYGEINSAEEIVFDKKSAQSFKEALLPITQVLFYFTEEHIKESDPPKGAIIFLRSCDLNAVKRLDEIYLYNGSEDFYYKRLRDNVRFVLMGCSEAFDSCFCADMGTNRCDDYDFSIDEKDGEYLINCKNSQWEEIFAAAAHDTPEVTPAFVTETKTRVSIPENLDSRVAGASMWEEYDGRCVSCGRCNFVCPTCTCYTMQDIFYSDNGRVGERRRVWASCMVDGFTDVAGGGSYRQKNGQRMRYKTLHKVLDFKQRMGMQMCVGCGRCDDVCPEYISFSGIINRLEDGMKEVEANAAK